MDGTLEIFATRFLGIFIEAVPFLLLGTLASGLIEVFIRKEDIVRLMPRNPVLATAMGGGMGFIFPVCECGVVPVTRRLFNKGLPLSVGITFLLSAPVMNPVVVASTYAAFGWGPVLVLRFVMTAIVAIGVGLVFTLQTRPQRILRPRMVALPISGGSAEAAQLAPSPQRMPLLPGLQRALVLARGEFFEMGRYLILGSLIAAAMGTFGVDKDIEALASNPVNSVFIMQLTGFVLSVCSTVDSFLALAFANTFTTGSILAFLVYGPMVDIKSTMMYLGVFRRKIVAYLIILPFLITALISIFLNLNVAF
ncbi:MAG: permease [Anaerolineae bacterium]|nr:permease [Anaerolineae bacterium]